MKYLPILVAAAISATACTANKEAATPIEQLVSAPMIGSTPPAREIPMAKVYQMSGPYAANIPVQINDQGQIVSFPGPGDVKGQEPIDLARGWYLDRRGVGLNTVFTTYTYADYAKLPTVPTVAELKAAIIPGARVIAVHTLDITLDQALADTAALIPLLPR